MIYENTTGLIHLISSLVALAAGALNITTEKGTAIHRKVGYVYTLSLARTPTTVSTRELWRISRITPRATAARTGPRRRRSHRSPATPTI